MLTLLCGKMGAGKSTKACEVAKESSAVLIAEDEWLGALYPNQIQSLQDYVHYSSLLKPLVKPLVQNILKSGSSVVMDFPGNTLAQREWLKSIFSEIEAEHELLFLDIPDEVCLKQIEQRREAQPQRAATDTEAMFRQVTKYFVEPSDDEGFNVLRVSGA